MKKHIVVVGLHIPDDEDITVLDYKSDASLLDADIVVFAVDLARYSTDDNYLGKPRLTDDHSFEVQAHTKHWKNELTFALKAGKTVIFILRNITSVYVFTGQKNYSGTGRNTRVTAIVDHFEPYSVSPVPIAVVRREGVRIKTTAHIGPVATYWDVFGKYSHYEAYLDTPVGTSILLTHLGDKTVGSIVRQKDIPGTLLILPYVDLQEAVADRSEILRKAKKKTVDQALKDARKVVTKQFVGEVVQLDKVLRSEGERTPPPDWARAEGYVLEEEKRLAKALDENTAAIATLEGERTQMLGGLEAAGRLKGLLYENGNPLEDVIIEALNILGFKAKPLREGDSQFDSVFVSPEGARLLGEAEGKNDRAIQVDKLDQLERNIREEFSLASNTEYAKGVLFGNGFRLKPPAERGVQFSDKCVLAAKRSNIALVNTCDLFPVAKYLREHTDPAFARECRDNIVKTNGAVVEFPAVPSATVKVQVAGKSGTEQTQTSSAGSPAGDCGVSNME
jgi:hypothetical protein